MMISRRKIISKSEDSSSSSSSSSSSASSSSSSSSSDNLYKSDDPYGIHDDSYCAHDIDDDEDDENTWNNFDQLVDDQLEEIRNKWDQIDDEIWAKIICFERNRRIAKAYARSPVISITGSERGFDGYRIGLNGFPNPRRDFDVKVIKQQIRSGFKLKIDDLGNIHIKRVGRCSVYYFPIHKKLSLRNNNNNNKINNSDSHHQSIMKTNNNSSNMLEFNKPRIIFDFKKFQTSMLSLLASSQKCSKTSSNSSSSSSSSPSMLMLKNQCVHCIQLVVHDESASLWHPCWILLFNIVALDLFWSKFKPEPIISHRQLSNVNGRRVKAKNPLYDPCEEDYSNDEDDNHDLYYCGYMAKISNQHQMGKPATIKARYVERKLDPESTNGAISRHFRPNPMRQLPTFNRIGLEQSKRLFFSSHQLYHEMIMANHNNNNDIGRNNETSTTTKTTTVPSKYLGRNHYKSHHHHRHHNHHNHLSRYNSKLNQKMKQTYRSTCDLTT